MKEKRSARSLFKRYIILLLGLIVMAFGVAFSINAALGTAPVSCPPYVAWRITGLSVGTATIIMHCIFIVAQICILRKNYKPIQLLQLPVALLFGVFNDIALYLVRDLTAATYMGQWVLCAIGIGLTAIGVCLEVSADVVMLAGEGMVLAVSQVSGIKFGHVKVAVDVALVVLAVVLSLVFLGDIEGIREGTVASALLVGLLTRLLERHMSVLDRFLADSPAPQESMPTI